VRADLTHTVRPGDPKDLQDPLDLLNPLELLNPPEPSDGDSINAPSL